MLTRRKDGRFLKTKTINGKKIFFYSSEPTEKRAEKDITKQMIEYAAKESIGKKLLKVCDEWEEHHYKNVKVQTEERYKSYVKRFNNFFEDEYIKKIEVNYSQVSRHKKAFFRGAGYFVYSQYKASASFGVSILSVPCGLFVL